MTIPADVGRQRRRRRRSQSKSQPSKDPAKAAPVSAATVIAEAPRLGKHRDLMRSNIAADLSVTIDRVNVKGTTSEALGFIGRREGIACQAIALIERTP